MIKITALRDTKFSSKSMRKIGLLLLFGSIIGACSSNLGRNVDLATQNAERAATQQALARAAQQKEQQRALEEEREREEMEAQLVIRNQPLPRWVILVGIFEIVAS